jgi:hypothetical protein
MYGSADVRRFLREIIFATSYEDLLEAINSESE